MVPVPKVEPVSGGGSNVETIAVQPGMHQIMTMNGSEPQVVHVFSLKDTNTLSKAITSEMKVEDTNEVISPDWTNEKEKPSQDILEPCDF